MNKSTGFGYPRFIDLHDFQQMLLNAVHAIKDRGRLEVREQGSG